MAGGGTIIQKSQLVEVKVSIAAAANQQRFDFRDQPQLRTELRGRTVYIDAIEAYNVNDVSNAPISGNAIISAAVMQKSFLTLFISTPNEPANKGEYINFMPLTTLHRTQSNQTSTPSPFVRDLIKFPGLQISWEKCLLNLASPIGTISADVSFLLNIYYHFGDQK
jgi:hypothetical protein